MSDIKPGRFTDRYIESLRPREKRYRVSDPAEVGLGILVHPTGRKIWSWRGRINGQTKNLSLGAYPAHTLADAREWARSVARGRDLGVNIAEQAARQRAEEDRLNQRTCNWLFQKYMENEGNHVRSASEKWRLYRKEIAPFIGERSIFDIGHDDLANLLQRKLAVSPSVSNHMQSLIRRWFRWSVTLGRHISGLTINPAADLMKLSKPKARERYLNDYELSLLLSVLKDGRWKMARPLLLVLYTGVRRSEAFEARWREFDLDKGIWALPGQRTKNGKELVLPLPDQAVALLKSSIPFVAASELVWPGYGNPSKPMSGFSKAISGMVTAMQRLAFIDGEQIEPWSTHDLRRSVASGMNGLHDEEHRPLISPWVVERIMNHALPGVQGVYNRWEYFAEKKAALKIWADHLDGLLARR